MAEAVELKGNDVYEDEEDWLADERFDVYRDTFENDFSLTRGPLSGASASSNIARRCKLESYHPAGPSSVPLSQRVANQCKLGERKAAGENKIQGRDDRATTEQVLDPRTRMILFKLLSNGTVSEINGCISTGKEANV